jgi:F0F1-type ATP synthase assembly protein I
MAVPVAIGLGFLCDRGFDTTPIGLLVGTCVGFGAMLLRIVRMRPKGGSEQEDDVVTGPTDTPAGDADDSDRSEGPM